MRMRQSARVVLLDEQERVLLLRCTDVIALGRAEPQLTVFWLLPGGGLEAGESFEDAARRELWEEVGLRVSEIGPCLWIRRGEFLLAGEPVQAEEHYFLVRVQAPELSWQNMLEQERQVYSEYRWWSLAELRESSEIFLPPGLAERLGPVLAGQLPQSPLLISDNP